MNKFFLSLQAMDKTVFEGECVSLIVPTPDGLYGIMAHHSNIIMPIQSGILSFRTEEDQPFLRYSAGNGVLRVENNRATVMCVSFSYPQE